MVDFTVKKYTELLHALMEQEYTFQTFRDYLTKPAARSIVLRHDVDKRPQNSLILATIESELGISGTYYFRARACSWDEVIIKEIAGMGHEIGYHYEDLSTYHGDQSKGLESFMSNLEKLRLLVQVSTICMHGSPRSKYDSRDLWKNYNYKELDLIGEPYFDVDFSKVLYLTDTGRKWDGEKVNIRDKVNNVQNKELSEKGYSIHSTNDIIKAAKDKAMYEATMLTIHPQRWHSNSILWLQELIMQNVKNVAKRVLLELSQ